MQRNTRLRMSIHTERVPNDNYRILLKEIIATNPINIIVLLEKMQTLATRSILTTAMILAILNGKKHQICQTLT